MADGKGQEETNALVLSFLAVRQALGWLGLTLPVLLIAGAWAFDERIAPSISDFYYTKMSDVFVGIMCAIGVFLISYMGYDHRPGELFSDKWVSRWAGATALGVALVPTAPDTVPPPACHLVQCWLGDEHASWLHYGFAAAFFAALAVFCLVLFTRSDPTRAPSREKRRRNIVFRACGGALVVSIAALVVYRFVLPEGVQATLGKYSYVFWFEALGVWAFGISWLVKGKMIGFLND